jgi:AcrR family transcriptional regulator
MASEKKQADVVAASRNALETRKRILDEAERLFRVYGYSKTTVADIAEVTRMSSANVYRFFATKSDINNAICERILAEDEAALTGIARLPLPATDRIRRLVLELNRRTLENFIENKKVHEMVIVAMEERWEAIRSHIHRVAGIIATIVEDGIVRGELRAQDAKRAAECVSAAMASQRHPMMLVQCMNDPEKASPDEIAEFIIAALR